MKKLIAKKSVAILIASLLLLSTLFIGIIGANAAEITDGLTHVATVSDNAKPFGQDYWVKETNINGGGVKLHWDMYSAWSNYFYDEVLGTAELGPFPGKYGFSLHFDGYTKTAHTSNYGDGIIAITFTHTPGFTRIRTNVPFIMIDTNAGTLSVAHGTSAEGSSPMYSLDAMVITNDLLKYDNIKDVPFTVEFSRYSDTQTQISVNVDGTYVAGLMNTAYISGISSGPNAANHYVFTNIGGLEMNQGAKVPFELNFYGHKLFDSTYVAPELSTVPQPDEPEQEGGLTHLAKVADNAKPFGADWWSKETDIASGGVALEWTMYSAWSNYFYDEALGSAQTGAFPGTYGFSLHFSGYNKTTETENYGDGIIAISFTHTPGYSRITTGVPFIMIDTNEGTLSVAHGMADQASQYEVDKVVITDDLLKYENIKDKPFVIEFSRYSDVSTQVSVKVDETYVTGLMETAFILNGAKGPSAGNHYIFASIGGLEFNDKARVPFKLNFLGHKLFDSTYVAPEIKIEGLASGLTHAAVVADNRKPFGNDWWAKESNIEGGGVNLKWTMYSAWSNFFYDEVLGTPASGAFPGKIGFSLHFGGYNKTTSTSNKGDGIIAISFTHTSGYTISTGVPFIMIDTNAGTLSVAHGLSESGVASEYSVDATIITNDVLKYESLKEVPFVLEFTRHSDTETQVSVDVNGTKVSGLMKTALITNGQRGPNATNHYIFASIGGIEFDDKARVPFELDFYGHKLYDSMLHEDVIVKAQSAEEVVAGIDALANSATLDASNEILVAKAKYDALSDANKAKVTNVDKLNTLIAELNALRNNAKYKPTSTYIAITPEPYEKLGYHPFGHPAARTVFSKETNNGFKVDFDGSDYTVAGYRVLDTQSVYGAFALDGLSLFIDNYNFEDAFGSDFYLYFTSGDYSDYWDGNPETSERMIAIRLGRAEDKLEINGVGLDDAWDAGNSKLITRDNLKGKQIIVEWNKQSNGDYICSLTIGEQVVAFVVSADKIAAMDGFDQNKVRVIIGAYDVKNEFSMELNGIYANLDNTVLNVTKQISQLPAKVESDKDVQTVQAVQKAYDALSVAQKEQILNADLLTAARAAVRKYQGVNEKGRDKDGFYIPNTLRDVIGDVSKNARFAYVTESNLGGLHYDFNNGGFGVANGFKNHYVVDNLTLRFDNFRYSNDNGFIIGFESVAGDCQTYNLTASLTTRSFFLLVGRDNTVYSTLGGATHEEMFPIYEPNELLSSTNLINKEFLVSLKYDTKTEKISVIFTVDGKSFTYTYTDEQMERMNGINVEDIEVLVQTGGGLKPSATNMIDGVLAGTSIDITGINYSEFSQKQYNQIDSVIAAINALPDKVTAENKEAVLAAWDMYFSLGVKDMRLAVTNHTKLISLYNQLFDKELLYDNEESNDGQNSLDNVGSKDDDDASYVEKVDGEDQTNIVKKPIKKYKDRVVTTTNSWLLITIIAGIVVGLAVIAMIIIFAVKRRKIKAEGNVNE